MSGPWQGPILAARRYPPGASGENRTLFASLEGWNSTNKSHSLYLQLLLFNYQRIHFDGSTWTVRSFQPRGAFTRSFGRQTHWSGTPDSNRDSHDPKSCGFSRFPSARKTVGVKSKKARLSTGPVMRVWNPISYGATDLRADSGYRRTRVWFPAALSRNGYLVSSRNSIVKEDIKKKQELCDRWRRAEESNLHPGVIRSAGFRDQKALPSLRALRWSESRDSNPVRTVLQTVASSTSASPTWRTPARN